MIKVKIFIARIIVAMDRFSPYPLFYSFIMSEKEKELFDQNIKNSKNYLEFGSGGSTLRVLQKSKAAIFSVESSLNWIKEVSKYLIVKLSRKRLLFHYADIGKTKGWGFPDGDSSKKLFPNYSASIFETIDPKNLDTVLVDGRFRVACALSTILHTFSNDSLTILVHDFWNREEYHTILKYVDEIGRADTLAVFKIRKDIDLNNLKDDYEKYKYIPD